MDFDQEVSVNESTISTENVNESATYTENIEKEELEKKK